VTGPIEGLIVSDFHVGNLVNLLSGGEDGPEVRARSAPFGEVVSVLAGGGVESGGDPAEFALVWTRPEAVISGYRSAARFEPFDPAAADAEVDDFVARIQAFQRHVGTVFVATWARHPGERGMGLLDLTHPDGPGRLLRRLNARLADGLSDLAGVHLLDADRWIAAEGASAFDPRLWYMAKIPYTPGVFRAAVRDVKAALRGLRGEGRRLVVVDLDDTMWGGIVGETGPAGLRLGGHDPVGEAYVDFQHALKALTRRGIILGVVSKNEESVALEAIREHPEMVLRLEDFAGWRINWRDKAENLVDLVSELNLGLASVVFLDDNPAERGRVREALPEVLVPDWPGDPMRQALELRRMDAFDQPRLSREDRERAGNYRAERERRTLRAEAPSIEDWLRDLELRVVAAPVGPSSLPRAVQLLNKTNQMNLRTRRMTEGGFAAWMEGPDRRSWVFRVQDRFSDAGLTGLVSLEVQGRRATLEDFILSCRVFGRNVEDTMLHVATVAARSLGAEILEARYLPTERNAPCLAFFRDRSGLAEHGSDPPTFVASLEAPHPLPPHVLLEEQ
jgi:FkbH-like protein